ncbi:MAG: MATE family efflux transporter [Thermoplasmata archaeon]|nr:MAG: MATE family efflux transporter [Thermoplasmata archaeon]
MAQNLRAERLGEEPVRRLLLRLSIPAAVGLIVSNSYNLVDTIFVGRLGVSAISALSVVFPIQMILASVAYGVGIGSSSLISRLLGRGDMERAGLAAGNSIFLSLIFWLVFAFVGYFFSESLVGLFVSDAQVMSLGAMYIRIILLGSIFLFYLRMALNILQGQGNYFLPMFIMVLTACLNIVLDPLLIFGWWVIPSLGLEGAAIATVVSRLVGCVLITFILMSSKNEVDIRISGIRMDGGVVKNIFDVGAPMIMMQLLMSITVAGTNRILEDVSITAIAVAGIYYKLQSFVLIPVLGLSRSFTPIIGYNYGARNYVRMREAVREAVFFSFVISMIGFLIFQIFPGDLVRVFNADPSLTSMGVEAFRRINLLFYVMGPSLIIISFFQGIGQGMKILYILMIRQFIIFFPVLYVFTTLFGLPDLWFAFPISDMAAVIIGLILSYPDFKRLGIINLEKIIG